MKRSRARVALIFTCASLATSDAVAHPTDEALHAAAAERAQCAGSVADESARLDRARIGMSEADLREQVGPLLPPVTKPGAGPRRLSREATAPLSRVEYDLMDGTVYAIRWRLDTSFERPVLDELVRRAGVCLGRAEYDQTIEAEPGSADATLRRIGWKHGDRMIELRQLHPLHGGAVYLTVRSNERIRAMGEAGMAPLPEPDRSAPWWQRSIKPVELADEGERKRLGDRFTALLTQLDH